jgi:hypothetical protein
MLPPSPGWNKSRKKREWKRALLATCFHSSIFLDLLLEPEDWGFTFFRNVSTFNGLRGERVHFQRTTRRYIPQEWTLQTNFVLTAVWEHIQLPLRVPVPLASRRALHIQPSYQRAVDILHVTIDRVALIYVLFTSNGRDETVKQCV